MQRIHNRIYIQKYDSYNEAREAIYQLNQKFGGRVKVSDISSYISLPFFRRKYKVAYTIEEQNKKLFLPKNMRKVGVGGSQGVTESLKYSIEKIVQKTLNLVYPQIKSSEVMQGFSASLTGKFIDTELLKMAISSGCVGEKILSELKNSLKEFITKTLSPACPIQIDNERKVIALVGPTGVGKTTTCVKIGTKFFIQKFGVSFLTLDIFRAEADRQLASFAGYMGSKCFKIEDVSRVEDVMKKIKDDKLVIIDTIGASQNENEKLSHIKQILDVIKPTYTFLVVPLNYSGEAVIDVLNKFSILNFNRIIISKADEATSGSCSLLFSIRTNFPGAPISYITCGQNPQDIQDFNPEKYVDVILSQHYKL